MGRTKAAGSFKGNKSAGNNHGGKPKNIFSPKAFNVSKPHHATAKVVPSMSVYKRRTEYPLLLKDFSGPRDRFIVPSDPTYEEVIEKCYKGFAIQRANQFSEQFHESFQQALDGLEAEGAYQFDLTQPAGLGSKVAKTFVTRCVVGEAGTTYKYLGLRMFAIPWDKCEIGASAAAVSIGKLNAQLVDASKRQLQTVRASKPDHEVGSCQFNLTLINRYDALDLCLCSHWCSLRCGAVRTQVFP